MSDINIDDLREQAELASSHPRERVELTGVEVLVLLDQLAAAEHRADEAEARIKAVRELLARWVDEYGDPVYRGNGWAEGVRDAAREALKALDGER